VRPAANKPEQRTRLYKSGSVKVVGAIYDVASGRVNWLPAERVEEILKRVEASPDKETEVFAAF
jgi:carbonic anhydrase